MSRGERRLRDENGELTEETAAAVAAVRELVRAIGLRLASLELLVGTNSDVYRHGEAAYEELKGAVGAVRGTAKAHAFIQAAVAEREAPGTGLGLLPDAREQFALTELAQRPGIPASYEPSDDANVAKWARARHNAGAAQAHDFMRSAHAYIATYRL